MDSRHTELRRRDVRHVFVVFGHNADFLIVCMRRLASDAILGERLALIVLHGLGCSFVSERDTIAAKWFIFSRSTLCRLRRRYTSLEKLSRFFLYSSVIF